jgi:leucyl/phenylalanyl-tRNA--protein transferase
MHELGLAHSCEVWYKNKLAGGIYGVALGGFFAGESMFHLVTNASTMGLKFLIDYLKNRGFVLFDSQVITPHTKKLGAIEIDRKTYLEKLRYALKLEVKIEKFEKK